MTTDTVDKKEFRQLTLEDLVDKKLLRYRRSLIAGKLGFVVTHLGKIQGFILPIAQVAKLKFETTEETTFSLAAADERLFDLKVDCIYLKFRGRAIAAIVAPPIVFLQNFSATSIFR